MAAARKSRGSTGSRKRSAEYGLKKVSLIPDISADHVPDASPEKKSAEPSPAKIDPISTSPLAVQAFELMQILDPLIGVAETAFFMNRSNELLGDVTPVTAIKEGRLDDVKRAIRAVAAEKGVFTTSLG
jgi:hypothetical protein